VAFIASTEKMFFFAFSFTVYGVGECWTAENKNIQSILLQLVGEDVL